jgi:hypothetical protein
MYVDLKQHLTQRMGSLSGPWVASKSGYEPGLCAALGFYAETRRRYWDASWNGYRLEFKKGTSIWLDLVRYSEIHLKVNEDAACDTLTLFFIPNGQTAIGKVICVRTCDLISKLGLDGEVARFLTALQGKVPRSLNAQASLTVNDVAAIATFVIPEGVHLDEFLA